MADIDFCFQSIELLIFVLNFKSKRMSRYPCDTKVYVGDLGNHARKNELEDSFGYYGPLRSVWIARNPPGFAFVEFESARDAEDAVRGLDGRTICGRKARVEVSSGKSGRGYGGRGGPRRGRHGSGMYFFLFFRYKKNIIHKHVNPQMIDAMNVETVDISHVIVVDVNVGKYFIYP